MAKLTSSKKSDKPDKKIAPSAASSIARSKVTSPKGLRVYDEVEAAQGFARVLLMGPSKGGKTTAVLRTAPGPIVVLNGDNPDALIPARRMGAKFTAVDCTNQQEWRKGCNYAYDLAEAGEVATVVVDTITLLVDKIYEQLKNDLTGFELWNEIYDSVMDPFRTLMDMNAHLFVVAHHIPSDSDQDIVGVMPAIPGKLKVRIPAMVNDWIWLDVITKRDPPCSFLLGPQKNWTGGGRGV